MTFSAAITGTATEPPLLPGPLAGSMWVRTLSMLAAVTMLLGIYIEALTIWKGVSETKVALERARVADVRERAAATEKKFEADIAEQKAAYAKLQFDANAREASFRAEVERQKSINAAAMQKAESDLSVAKARVAAAEASVSQRLEKAKAEYAETKGLQDRLSSELLEVVAPR